MFLGGGLFFLGGGGELFLLLVFWEVGWVLGLFCFCWGFFQSLFNKTMLQYLLFNSK